MINNRYYFYDKYIYHKRMASFYFALLLIADGHSVREAIAASGINATRFREMIKQPKFKEEFLEAQRLGEEWLVKHGQIKYIKIVDAHTNWLSKLEKKEKEIVLWKIISLSSLQGQEMFGRILQVMLFP